MDKDKILAEAKAELERHVWGTFVEGKASVALGGTGVIVSGCEASRKRFGTNSQYLRYLADDVLPGLLKASFSPCAPDWRLEREEESSCWMPNTDSGFLISSFLPIFMLLSSGILSSFGKRRNIWRSQRHGERLGTRRCEIEPTCRSEPDLWLKSKSWLLGSPNGWRMQFLLGSLTTM
jgi:hypothetical protein